MSAGKIKKQDLTQFALVLAIIILVNVISAFVFTRMDLTSEKRYTISPATKNLLSNLNDVVFVKVYLEGDFPAGFKKLRNATREMLDEFRVYAKGNIQYEFINPSTGTDQKEKNRIYNQLADKGLQPTNLEVKEGEGLSQKIIFPGAIMTYVNNEFPIQLLKNRLGSSPDEMLNNSIEGLEYELANGIRQLTLKHKPRIAFEEGHGEPDSLKVYDLSQSLKTYYNFSRVSIKGKIENDSVTSSLSPFDVLIIAKPDSAFSNQEKFLTDQFIMNGGKVLWLIDGMSATMDSLVKSNSTIAIDLPLNLEDQLFTYGVRINPDLLMDLKCSPIPMVTGIVGNQPRTELRPWFFFPLVIPENVHPIVSNLNAILFKFASSLDTVGAHDIKKTMLLQSSKYTKVVYTPARISLSFAREKPQIAQFVSRPQGLAVLLEGEFRSVFKNRVPLELTNYKLNFREKSKPTKMIVVSDGDIIINDFKKSTGKMYPLGYDSYTGQENGNKNFLLNAIDYLCDDSGLIELRSKELKLRMLDKTRLMDEKLKWQLINTLAPALLILIFGFVNRYRRIRRYAS